MCTTGIPDLLAAKGLRSLFFLFLSGRFTQVLLYIKIGPRSAVGNLSGRLQIQGSRVRSRPGPILSWSLIMKYILWSFSSPPLNHSRRIVVSYKRNYVRQVLDNC